MTNRGCGTRVQGGIYCEVATSPDGKPLEYFLLEPPRPVPEEMGLPARGVQLFPQNNYDETLYPSYEVPVAYHIADRIGSESYPNVADWVEETRRYGASRRLSPALSFSSLDENSKLWVAHSKALISNPLDYYAAKAFGGKGRIPFCPKDRLSHRRPGVIGYMYNPNNPDMCIGLWWEDLDPSTVMVPDDFDCDDENFIGCMRTIGDTLYIGKPTPEYVTPQYQLAFFAILPISRLVVVKGDNAEENYEKAAEAHIEVALVDE